MAQQAIEAQQSAPTQPGQQQQQSKSVPTSVSDPTTNLLYPDTITGNNNNPGVVGSGRGTAASSGQQQLSSSGGPGSVLSLTQPPAPTGEAHIPPLLGVAPLGPVALSKEQQVLCLFIFFF